MRTRAGYNEAKAEILEAILKRGEATTHQIGLITDRRYETAAMLMLQYFRFGLLRRRRLKGLKTFVYSVTEQGVERLSWLNQLDAEEEPESEEPELTSEEKELEDEIEKEFQAIEDELDIEFEELS